MIENNGQPQGWIRIKLGDLTEPSKEKVKPQDVLSVPYIGLEHIEKETGRLLGYGNSDEVRSTKVVFYPGDLLYGKLRPYLNKVYVPDFEGICSTDILMFPKNEYFSNRFLYYRFLSADFVRYANQNVSGVQHPRVSPTSLAEFDIDIPPFPEQERIVAKIEELFTQLDAGVSELQQAKTQLQRYRQAVHKAAVEGELTRDWRESRAVGAKHSDFGSNHDQPGHPNASPRPETAEALLERILSERRAKWEAEKWEKEIECAQKKAAQAKRKAAVRSSRIADLKPEEWQNILGDEYSRYLPKNDKWKTNYKEPELPDMGGLPGLPKSWVWATVEQLASFNPRSIQSGPFGSSLLHSEFQDTGVLAIGIDNVLNGNFSLGQQQRISLEKYEQLKKFTARPLDVLITVMATVGRSCVVPLDLETAIVTKHIYRISTNQDILNPYFMMYCLLGSSEVREQIFGGVRGQTRPGINKSVLVGLAIPIPPLLEQVRIVEKIDRRLSVTDEIEHELDQSLSRADRLRQSILKRAFEGKLVEHNPNDEPASVLLERIKVSKGMTPVQLTMQGIDK